MGTQQSPPKPLEICPWCGMPVEAAKAAYCPRCGGSLTESLREGARLSSPLVRQLLGQWFRGGILFLAFIVAIWSLLSYFLPEGWWHLALNIGFLLWSLASALPLKRVLDVFLPGWLSLWLSLLLALFIIIVGRSLFLTMLEWLFGGEA